VREIMKREHSNIGASTSSRESTDAAADPRRMHLGRRALLRCGALSLAGAISARFSAEVLAQDPEKSPFQMVVLPYLDGMDFGKGFDVLTGARLGTAVDPGQITRPTHGQIVDFQLTRVDSQEDVFKAIGIDVAASGHYSFFSAEATFKFANELKMSRQSTHLLTRITVTNTADSCNPSKLTPEALKLKDANNFKGFRNQYGDGYVSTMLTGGEYFALYSIFSESLDIQESAHASLKFDFNAGLAGGAGVNVAISEKTKDLLSRCTLDIRTHQRGGDGEGSGPATDLQEIMMKIKGFPKEIERNGVIDTVIVTGYTSLFQWDWAAIEAQQQALKAYTLDRLRLQEKRDDVVEQMIHPTAFVRVPAATKLKDWNTYLTDELNDLNQTAINCGRTGTCPLFSFSIPVGYQEPERPDLVILFEKENYAGKVRYIKDKGWYDHDAPEMGWRVDLAPDAAQLNSIKIPKGLRVRFYDDWHFQAKHLDVTQDQPDLGEWKGRQVNSLVVYGSTDPEPVVEQVVIFSEANYTPGNGAEIVCRLNESLNIDPKGHEGWFDRVGPIRSIKVPEGMKVTVWEQIGFQGAPYDAFNDVPYPEPELGRPVGASLKVFRLP
jgi:hypothetical protein